MAQADRKALIALYNATGGAKWKKKKNWNTGAALSRWEGVNVTAKGRVLGLILVNNNLQGPTPKALGNLSKLQTLWLSENHLTGQIPEELGALRKLENLWIEDNDLTGELPASLGQLVKLESLRLDEDKLSGGPTDDESLSQWTARLRKQSAEQERSKQKIVEQNRVQEHASLESRDTIPTPEGRVSSPGGGDTEHEFRVQAASFPEVEELTRDNRGKLEDVKRLLGKPAVDTVRLGTELTDREKLRELDRLVAMAKTLGEMTSRHTEGEGFQRKEAGLARGPKEYYTAIRGGLCNAYLAASVVGSGLVSTSKIGAIGKAGTALQLMSGAVPLVGGLAGFTGAALKAGDCYVQTRRVAKITDLAPDAVECCKLARTLALRLTDGLPDGHIATSRDAEEKHTHSAAGVGWGAGGSKFGALTDNLSEEAVMDWFIEEVANYEPSDSGETAGRRLGKRHLRKILTAVGQDCLQGANDTGAKVNVLVSVVLPEAGIRPAETSSASVGGVVQSPVSAPTRDGNLQNILAELEALKADKEKHSAELEALKADKEKHYAELEALKAENKELQGQVATFEKRLPKSQGGPGDSVDAGGGQLLAQERKTKTLNEFMHDMENPARAADREAVTLDEHRITQARVEEVGRETGHLDARVVALEEGNRGKKKGLLSRLCCSGC